MNTSSFKDHFSKQAGDYAKYRPRYPKELFAYLASLCPQHQLAWDGATGNGQAAESLAEHFERVIATDASEKQILAATPHQKIDFRVEPAEQTSLTDTSVDLVTVAQAIHWLDHEKFYAEVERVLRPDGILAVWVYSLDHIAPEIDRLKKAFYHETVGPYWPEERRYIDEELRTLPFPYKKIKLPDNIKQLFVTAFWDVEEVLNYLHTWSATQKYKEAKQEDPVQKLEAEFRKAWGPYQKKREVKWPLHFCIGRKESF